MLGAVLMASQAAAQCCDYMLVMHDSYGDGWNGGQLILTVNGIPLGTFAAAGTGSDTSFSICNGDTLHLDYTPGDYENENTYSIFDPSFNFVFGDGPTPAIGSVFTGIGNCDSIAVPGSVPCAALPIDTILCVTADNTGAGNSGHDPGCANFQGGDIWFAIPFFCEAIVFITGTGTV